MLGAEAATTDLLDVFDDELAVCELDFRQYGGRRVFAGPAHTVRCREDNALMRELIHTASDGAVVVVDGGGSLRTALLGDQLAEIARAHGWAGFVIAGAVRDSSVLPSVDIGIQALGTNPRRSRKEGLGAVDVPVSVGGVVIAPGDFVWCDDDGVISATPDVAERVIAHLNSTPATTPRGAPGQ